MTPCEQPAARGGMRATCGGEGGDSGWLLLLTMRLAPLNMPRTPRTLITPRTPRHVHRATTAHHVATNDDAQRREPSFRHLLVHGALEGGVEHARRRKRHEHHAGLLERRLALASGSVKQVIRAEGGEGAAQ